MSTYVHLARDVAIPTPEQTRAFAEFVTGAHSWYKHLAIDPPTPFVFYLDPNAGRDLVQLPGGTLTAVDNNDDPRLHYTWQPTQVYRQRFGFWDYADPERANVYFNVNEGGLQTTGPGAQILSPEGEWLGIPEGLVRVGTVRLSALMWYPTWRPTLGSMSQGEKEMRICCIFPVTLPFRGVTIKKDREELINIVEKLPSDMAAALRQLLSLWMSSAYQHEADDAYRAYEQYCADNSRPSETTTDPGSILNRQAGETWEATASRRQERGALEALNAALDQERERQIEAMVRAMTGFVEVLHSGPASLH